MSLEISSGIVEAIVRDVEQWGTRRRETGLFLLSAASMPGSIVGIAWPGPAGITRRAEAFAVSGLALARLFEFLDETERRAAALVHSHRVRAFLSEADVTHGFSVDGFVSAVVPSYAAPPRDASEWGWWRYREQAWMQISAPAETATPFFEVAFDEESVDEQ